MNKAFEKVVMITSPITLAVLFWFISGLGVAVAEPYENKGLASVGVGDKYSNKVTFRQSLRFNPFVVPDYVANISGSSSLNLTESDMELRAVLISEGGSLVNVNGVILGIDQDINGYVLKSVYEDRAVFMKREREFVLSVNKSDAGLNAE